MLLLSASGNDEQGRAGDREPRVAGVHPAGRERLALLTRLPVAGAVGEVVVPAEDDLTDQDRDEDEADLARRASAQGGRERESPGGHQRLAGVAGVGEQENGLAGRALVGGHGRSMASGGGFAHDRSVCQAPIVPLTCTNAEGAVCGPC